MQKTYTAKPTATNVTTLKQPAGDFRTTAPPPEQPKAQAEPTKRTKSEKVHEGRGYASGVAHGTLIGLAAGLTAAFLAFSIAGPVLADYGARIEMVHTARDAALTAK